MFTKRKIRTAFGTTVRDAKELIEQASFQGWVSGCDLLEAFDPPLSQEEFIELCQHLDAQGIEVW